MTILILSTLGAILISGICSISEATLLSLNPIRLETSKQQGRAYASVLLRMREQVDQPISAILILNTIANTGGAVIAGGAFDTVFGAEWMWLFTTFFALSILYISEIIPKIAGVVYNEQISPWVAWFLVGSIALLWPLIFITEKIARAIRGGNDQEESPLSAMDMLTMARLARSSKVIGATQEAIIANAVKLRETTVQKVMIPREQIVFFQQAAPMEENLQIARQALHTRYPVSASDSVDDIIGYVNFKELMLTPNLPAVPLESFLRSLMVVTPDTRLSTMFQRLIGGRHHIIIVKDPDGHIVGMATLEDVIEEIIGDIEDEFDSSPATIIPINAQSWNAGGNMPMRLLTRYCTIPLDETAAALTLDDWLQTRMGAVPQVGLSVRNGPIRFTIRQVRRGRIYYVLVECDERRGDEGRGGAAQRKPETGE